MKLKSLIIRLANSKFLHLSLGGIVALSGFLEVKNTLAEDLLTGELHSGHGALLLGVWHLLHALGELAESTNYLKEGME